MNVILIFLLMIMFALFFLGVLKKQKITIILIIIFCVMIGITNMYFLNSSFRDNVNIHLNPTYSHRYIVNNRTYNLPLPPKTTLKYRTSDVSAVYITKTDLDKIVTLYKKVSDNGTFSESQNNNEISLSFKYNDYIFSIIIETGHRRHTIFVNGDVPDFAHFK